jgi:hypothetical protein
MDEQSACSAMSDSADASRTDGSCATEGAVEADCLRRYLPGTAAKDLWTRSITSPETNVLGYIRQLIREDSSRVERIYEQPENVHTNVWIFEHVRHFVIEFNSVLLSALIDECTIKTCPKMTVSSEWQYLCAAHKRPQECAAIRYVLHTVDSSTTLLTSSLRSTSAADPIPQIKHFPSLVRRLYRILAHVYFHHQQVFYELENETHLCARFSYFAIKFDLMQQGALLVPSEAYLVEGLGAEKQDDEDASESTTATSDDVAATPDISVDLDGCQETSD